MYSFAIKTSKPPLCKSTETAARSRKSGERGLGIGLQISGRTDIVALCLQCRRRTRRGRETDRVKKENRGFSLRCLRDFLCGVLIGAGAILPGVSGGVLAVIFDLYRPFMELLTHPKRALPKYWRLLIPLGLGWAAGFFSFAKGVSAALDVSAAATTWAFIGLIVGTLPSLCREAGVVLTGAGAAFPYGRDPHDSNIRLAPTYPAQAEVEEATRLLCVALRLATVEHLLAR